MHNNINNLPPYKFYFSNITAFITIRMTQTNLMFVSAALTHSIIFLYDSF